MIISTLSILGVAYALAITFTATTWALDDTGYPSVGYKSNVNIGIAAALFWGWVDVLMFVAVAVVLRDRYLASAGKTAGEQTPPFYFVAVMSVVSLLLFVSITAHVGVWGSALLGLYDRTLSSTQATDKINISNGLFYAFLGVSLISTFFLLAFAVVVRRRNRSDKVCPPAILLYTL
jgi:hypothetical protein